MMGRKLRRGLQKQIRPHSVPSSSQSTDPLQPSNVMKVDPIVAHMEQSNTYYENELVRPLQAIFKDILDVRNYAACSPEMQ